MKNPEKYQIKEILILTIKNIKLFISCCLTLFGWWDCSYCKKFHSPFVKKAEVNTRFDVCSLYSKGKDH